MILKRVLYSGIAISLELRSSRAITGGPCADLVWTLCVGGGIASVYLDFTQLVRDLVRLKCYAGLGTYQEEVRSKLTSIYVFFDAHTQSRSPHD